MIEDADAIRDLLVETWHATYEALYGAQKVTEITDLWHAVAVLRRQIKDSTLRCLVAEHGGILLGHALARPLDAGAWELARLYVAPTWQGQGHGDRLLEAATLGASSVRLSVERLNDRAVRFYTNRGFVAIEAIIEDDCEILIMERGGGG
jgi:ribosomal protein S18 acetylase RimI-like enzyme